MSTKRIDFTDQVKKAREEFLSKARFTNIQPRGKYHGFDVFTWLDAPETNLISTFHSMPFPIHWICTLNYFNVVVNSGHVHFPNVQQVYLVNDGHESPLVNSDFPVFEDVSSILKVPEIYQGKGILLVTGCGNQGIDTINEMSLILKAIHGL